MLRHSNHIELWSLGTSQKVDNNYTGLVDLQEEPKKLLVLHKTVTDQDDVKEREGISCCCISNNGKWIMYSTNLGSRLFKLERDADNLTLDKIEFEKNKVPCILGTFTSNSSQLITCPNSGGLNVHDLKDGEVVLRQTIEIKEIEDTIMFLQMSPCGKYLLVGDSSSNIVIWTSKNKQWVPYCKLPKYRYPATAMSIHPKTLYLVVSYSDSKIVEYDVKKRQYTPFTEKLSKLDFKSKFYPIKSITFDPRVNSIIIFHDDSSIYVINKEKAFVDKRKKAKITKDTSPQKAVNGIDVPVTKVEVNTLKKYKHLVHFEWLSKDEMVAVEVNPLALFEKLPPAFAQTTFGNK
ncbi:unnamed protein product [Callosobruchus maculatus]|nr:unnamed protein product [Callosobruchus maculatus]